jgi:hypothetical protein
VLFVTPNEFNVAAPDDVKVVVLTSPVFATPAVVVWPVTPKVPPINVFPVVSATEKLSAVIPPLAVSAPLTPKVPVTTVFWFKSIWSEKALIISAPPTFKTTPSETLTTCPGSELLLSASMTTPVVGSEF